MKNLPRRIKSLKSKILKKDTEVDGRKWQSISERAQGSAFSGSSYNGKGVVDHGKIRSNKKRR